MGKKKLEKGSCGCFDTKQGWKARICWPKNKKRPVIIDARTRQV